MQISLLNNKGQKKGKLELPKEIFEISAKDVLISSEIRRILANLRTAQAKTKKRGQVSGGGRKPYRQKGTGRARAGSIRSPLWRGGGIIFGPSGRENFSLKTPKKQIQKALLAVLSEKAKTGQLIVVDKFAITTFKTKEFLQILQKLPIAENSTILLVLAQFDEKLIKSASNLNYLQIIFVSNLNIFDLLKYDFVVMDKLTLEYLISIFQGKK
ncbi:MAG: 50S ribosomal protein L4 [Candidatus Nealsonbacteria bacterium CG23_combo_of_CG06-09_8_20_14_all_40_13]|uniref:Large ribosomal subunit protein uL4 n=1 Tax=Candidatus Nealsonbacteria bacterium CG23_combo_of_CG06-09_8_20_14_all_40_13 TaxID=1974724 RepID=A0A2G9YRA5_9BACT|nr:MAG: 50S ribosomal protein L4 [Candidatus Nealsonbacteria bacterium CG23_combo_of_CG06-09_8_20_14_all_40_13]